MHTQTIKKVQCVHLQCTVQRAHSNNKKSGVCTLAVHSAVCTFAQLSVASAPFQEPGKSTQPPGLRQWLLPVLGQCFICSLQKKQPYLTWYSTCISVGHILIRKCIKFWLLYSFLVGFRKHVCKLMFYTDWYTYHYFNYIDCTPKNHQGTIAAGTLEKKIVNLAMGPFWMPRHQDFWDKGLGWFLNC